MLFYQDVNEQFEGYTQRDVVEVSKGECCFIRMSMNNLKDIHNETLNTRYIRQLFYQDFNEQFKEYTIRTIYNVLLMNVP